jgi:hypothetical protein
MKYFLSQTTHFTTAKRRRHFRNDGESGPKIFHSLSVFTLSGNIASHRRRNRLQRSGNGIVTSVASRFPLRIVLPLERRSKCSASLQIRKNQLTPT